MIRRTNHSSSTTTAASAHMTPVGSVQSPSRHVVNSQARMGQILDDKDHKRCSEGNQRALLAENLDQLRDLAKLLELDDWKYAPQNRTHNGNVASEFRSFSRW